MLKAIPEAKFLEIFPYFRNASSSVVRKILSRSKCKAVPPNMMLQMGGLPCERIGFVLSGEKRVLKGSETGREITIYEIEPGELCIRACRSIKEFNPVSQFLIPPSLM